jgi:FtsZ-interacting cell division protein ZipA
VTIDLESWQAIAGAVAIVTTTVYNRWESRKTRKVAERAVELSEPTGNGFARLVKESLVRIEAQGRRTEKKIDGHIASHADADVHRRVA